jgi:hypothetical protein
MDRLVKGVTDKIRQAGSGMPAVLIRRLENLGKLMRVMPSPELRAPNCRCLLLLVSVKFTPLAPQMSATRLSYGTE